MEMGAGRQILHSDTQGWSESVTRFANWRNMGLHPAELCKTLLLLYEAELFVCFLGGVFLSFTFCCKESHKSVQNNDPQMPHTHTHVFSCKLSVMTQGEVSYCCCNTHFLFSFKRPLPPWTPKWGWGVGGFTVPQHGLGSPQTTASLKIRPNCFFSVPMPVTSLGDCTAG